MIKAIFFDAGETLIHRNPSLVVITKRLLASKGYKVDTKKLADILQFRASSMRKIVEKGIMTDSKKWDYFLKSVFKDLKIKDNFTLELIKTKLKEGKSFRMYSEVPGVLKELRKSKLILGVISNASTHLGKILERAKLLGSFDHVIVSEIVGVEKPDKKIFNMAVKAAGVKNDEFLFVGDNYIADVLGAAGAGLKAVWLARPTKNAQFSFAGAAIEKVIKVKNLKELVKYLKEEKML